jgi:glycosyltransferase involved in cell wall biosynthesis
MKVAVLSRVAYPLHGVGGFERHVGSMVRHLVRKGIEVTLYTAPEQENRAGGLDGTRIVFVPYRSIPWPRRPGFVIADRGTNYLLWSLRAGRSAIVDRPDIVQAEGAAGFGYAFSRNADSAPMVVHPVGMEEFKAGGLKHMGYFPLRAAARLAARRAERVIVPDRVMMDEVQRYLYVDAARTVILPTPIDLEEVDRPVSPAARDAVLQRLGVGSSSSVFLSVGRLESNKGFSILVDALARVQEKLPAGWLWILVGSGPEASRLSRRLSDLGLTGHARLAGRVSDEELSALYDRSDLFLHPTLYEGSSLVTLEAMAHAKPVVATTAGGIPDKVEPGESGFLVPPGNAGALGAAILEAVSAREKWAAMGKAGRRRVESDFSWSGRIESLIDVYRELVESRPDARPSPSG